MRPHALLLGDSWCVRVVRVSLIQYHAATLLGSDDAEECAHHLVVLQELECMIYAVKGGPPIYQHTPAAGRGVGPMSGRERILEPLVL